MGGRRLHDFGETLELWGIAEERGGALRVFGVDWPRAPAVGLMTIT
jgi:hypothetical protein